MRSFVLRQTVTVLLSAVTILCSFNALQAQGSKAPTPSETLMSEIGGKPIFIKTEYLTEGTPFFPEQYTKSVVVLKSGKTFEDIRSRMNLYDNTLLVLRDNGSEQAATGPVSKVIYELLPVGDQVRNVVFQRGFPSVDRLDSTTYYEVLDSGKLKLLKYHKTNYMDKRGYAEASMTRVFTNTATYYIVSPGNIISQLERGKEEFLSVVPAKRKELEKYIDSKKLKCKKEEDWIDLVAYYNSL